MREIQFDPGVHPCMVVQKIWASCRRWLRPASQTKGQILEEFMLEQFISILSNQAWHWVLCQKPTTLDTAVLVMVAFVTDECLTPPIWGWWRKKGGPQELMWQGRPNPTWLGDNFKPHCQHGTTRVLGCRSSCPDNCQTNAGADRGLPLPSRDGSLVCFQCVDLGHFWWDCPMMGSWAKALQTVQLSSDSRLSPTAIYFWLNGHETWGLLNSGCRWHCRWYLGCSGFFC